MRWTWTLRYQLIIVSSTVLSKKGFMSTCRCRENCFFDSCGIQGLDFHPERYFRLRQAQRRVYSSVSSTRRNIEFEGESQLNKQPHYHASPKPTPLILTAFESAEASLAADLIVTPAQAPLRARSARVAHHETRRQGKISSSIHPRPSQCRLTLRLTYRGSCLPAVRESKALTSTLLSHG